MKSRYDVLQAAVTSVATASSATLDTTVGNLDSPLWASVPYSAAANASGSNTVWWELWHSDDNVTFNLHTSGSSDTITLSTVAQSGEIFVPLLTKKRYKQIKVNVAGAGVSPTVTWNAALATAPY